MMKLLAILAALAYLLWPYDLLADVLPGWGWADDVVVLFILWRYLQNLKSARRRDETRGQAGSQGNGSADSEAGKDPFAVLGLRANATPEEVNRAYRQLASKYHPDKVVHLGDEFRKLAEVRFKEIQAAYDKLKRS